MHDYDIQTTLDTLGRTFEEFKETQNARFEILEKKGTVDPLIEEKLEKLGTTLDKAENRLKKMEALSRRPLIETEEKEVCEHKQAFLDYISKGSETALLEYEQKRMATLSEGDGGFLVPPGLHDRLYATLQEASVMRGLASVREISTSALELLIDSDTADVGWVSEIEERAETRTPELFKIRIPVHELYARPRATQKLLDDASLNVEEWLTQKISQKMAHMENQAFICGDGENKPLGILSRESLLKNDWRWGTLEEIRTGVNGDFHEHLGAETLMNCFYALKPAYLPQASWLMSRTAQSTIRRLRDPSNHQYLWQPPLGAMRTPTLMGYPVVVTDDMPSLVAGTASKSVLFGNFKEGYQIVDRTGTRVLRDPYSAKPYVEFYATRRVGGDMVNFEALKVINFSE